MAVQLVVVAIAYLAAERVNRLTHAFGRGFAPYKVRVQLRKLAREHQVGRLEAGFVVAIALGFAAVVALPSLYDFGGELGGVGDGQAGVAGPGKPAASLADRATAAPVTAVRHAGTQATALTVATTPKPAAGADLRHCLGVGDSASVVRCAEARH